MQSSELVKRTLHRLPHKGNAFWVGHPVDETKAIYYQKSGITSHRPDDTERKNAEHSMLLAKSIGIEEINFNRHVKSDMIWISPELDMRCWRHPEGKPMWDCFREKQASLGTPGIFAQCESVEEVEAFDWPNPDYIDLGPVIEETRYARDAGLAVFGGMWCPFFHVVADFFGMENYFCKMYTDPDVVQAVTEHVVDFYLRANERVLVQTGDMLCAGFFGNDFGSQLDLMISPECFDAFLYPYLRKIIDGIRHAGLKVAMHSCGSIDRIIPKMIDAGVEILHPLQAQARNMDAQSLARKYGGKLIFMGGVDTQALLPFGTSRQVYDEVLRLRDLFGDDFIVSPSHEALLPNVPYENVCAMAKAAKA